MWGSIISAGLGYLGSRKSSKATERATKGALEAASPKSVMGMLSQAVWDPKTKQYRMELSPEALGLLTSSIDDAKGFREQRQELTGDADAIALRRARQQISALEPSRANRYSKTLGNLYGRGLATSSVGGGLMSDLARNEQLENLQALQSSRSGVQSDITNLLNRENAARQGMMSIAGLPQNLANIGINVGSNLGTAAMANSKLIAAQGKREGDALAGLGKYLGQTIGGLNQSATKAPTYNFLGANQGAQRAPTWYDTLDDQDEALMWGLR